MTVPAILPMADDISELRRQVARLLQRGATFAEALAVIRAANFEEPLTDNQKMVTLNVAREMDVRIRGGEKPS